MGEGATQLIITLVLEGKVIVGAVGVSGIF
jgi:hypothetical protein